LEDVSTKEIEKDKTLKENRYLSGLPVRDRILLDVKSYSVNQNNMGALVSICIGQTPETAIYVRNQANAARKSEIKFNEQIWDHDITQEECKQRILKLNDSSEVLGIILQRPVPNHINVRSLQSAIHPLKDVEGMNPASIGNIVYSDIAMAPCTAAASVELIRETGLKMEGLEVVMIGHSEIVGKPIAFLLMAEGATVTVCHHMTRSVAMHSRRADVVIVAIGKPLFIKSDMIKPGAAVIDIGINQISDMHGVTKIVGDVDSESVKEIAGWITPVPGGVGPVTVAMLMKNAVHAHKRQKEEKWI
jgi:methylenetetrahydrofolate dehydrogenase (NADP+)/methenyltetrahydrofolate cyclohydrolase